MAMMDDSALLHRYAEERSEEAFAELVRRHIGLVYHAALRQTGGDTTLAEDATQAVFTDLARKARVLAQRPVITGWLYTSTRFAAAKARRTERRRQVREQEAQLMHELNQDTGSATEWERLRPVIDDALHALDERDREAVLLRFFEGRPFAEIGAKLSLTEDTARVRVGRALDKMHARLARRGVTSTAAALAAALANQTVAAAPAGLAATVTGAALAGAMSGAEVAWLAFFTMNKIKAGVVGAILLAALVPALVEGRAHQALSDELQNLQAGENAAQRANTQLMTALAKVGAKNPVANESGELAKMRARAAVLRARPEGVVEAEMRPPANAGWATPEAAFETMNWAVTAGDWATFAKSWKFERENKSAADAFFAGLSPEAREKYGTPERVLAHALLESSFPHGSDWMVAMQVYDVQVVDGPAPMKVLIWQRLGDGHEFANAATLERSAGGWVAGQPGVAKILKILIPQLDSVSGELRPKQK